jgi:hypothetical protein
MIGDKFRWLGSNDKNYVFLLEMVEDGIIVIECGSARRKGFMSLEESDKEALYNVPEQWELIPAKPQLFIDLYTKLSQDESR